jgi:hypothetical protein
MFDSILIDLLDANENGCRIIPTFWLGVLQFIFICLKYIYIPQAKYSWHHGAFSKRWGQSAITIALFPS